MAPPSGRASANLCSPRRISQNAPTAASAAPDGPPARGTQPRIGSGRISGPLLPFRDEIVSLPPVLPSAAATRTPSATTTTRSDALHGLVRSASILYEGVLKKRTTRAGKHLSSWNDKHFVLRGNQASGLRLEYYSLNAKSNDVAPRMSYALCSGCTITPELQEVRSSGRVLYMFRIEWPNSRAAERSAADARHANGSAAAPAAANTTGTSLDSDGDDEAEPSGRSGLPMDSHYASHFEPGFFAPEEGDVHPASLPSSPGAALRPPRGSHLELAGTEGLASAPATPGNSHAHRRTISALPAAGRSVTAGAAGAEHHSRAMSDFNAGGSSASEVAAAGTAKDDTVLAERRYSGAWLRRRKASASTLTQRRSMERSVTHEETRNETIQSLVDAQNLTRQHLQQLNEQFREQLLERGHEPEQDGKSKFRAKVVTGVKIGAAVTAGVTVAALTAGVGLVAGLIVVGVGAATTGAGGVGYLSLTNFKGKHRTTAKPLILASDNREIAEQWRAAIEAQLRSLEVAERSGSKAKRQITGIGHVLGPVGIGVAPCSCTAPATPETDLQRVDKLLSRTSWVSRHVVHGIRIFEEDQLYEMPCQVPTLKAQAPVRASPLETFLALMASPQPSLNGVVNSLRVVETLDDHSDVVHLCVRQAWVGLSWSSPRDFCLARHWRLNDEGCYIVCLDSTTHADCPEVAGHVRAEMNACYTIAPRKDDAGYTGVSGDSLLTHYLRVDPRGWLWRRFGFVRRYNLELMMHILDVRDVIEAERFATPTLCLMEEPEAIGGSLSFSESNHRGSGTMGQSAWAAAEEAAAAAEAMAALPWAAVMATVPAPALYRSMWSEADGTTFQVRGPTYDVDRVKVMSLPQVFRLVAVDLYRVPEPQLHIASRPDNRVQLARRAGERAFVWILQIIVPGPPHYAFVCYFSPPDPSIMTADTPFGRVARHVFFGDDDRFRDERLKLIPKIVEGNWVVKRAAGSTPAILGAKLRQAHFRGDNYLETDVDIGSSSIAASITRLSTGYAKGLVVDMAWTLQGNTEEELPEVILGGVRCNRIDMASAALLAPLKKGVAAAGAS